MAFPHIYFGQSNGSRGDSNDAVLRPVGRSRSGDTAGRVRNAESTAMDLTAADAALVQRLRARDASAYDEVIRTYVPRLVRLAASIVQSHDVAEDVVQQVLVRLWEQADTWFPRGSVLAYLCASVRNDALKVLRRQVIELRYRRDVQVDRDMAWTVRTADAPDANVLSAEQHRLVAAALSTLTEHQQTAFLLRYEQRLTVPEIAHILGISTKGAEKLVSRVTRMLRDRLYNLLG